jgi:hypothetical protein
MRDARRRRRRTSANLADLFVFLLILGILALGTYEGYAAIVEPHPSVLLPLWESLPLAR